MFLGLPFATLNRFPDWDHTTCAGAALLAAARGLAVAAAAELLLMRKYSKQSLLIV